MKLKVSLTDFSVEEVIGLFGDLPGIKHNGQHFQLPGFVLAEVQSGPSGMMQAKLLHPNTEPRTGHADLYYEPGRYSADESPLELSWVRHQVWLSGLAGTESTTWPTGIRSLILTLDAIERHLGTFNNDQSPIWDWLASLDRALHEVTFPTEKKRHRFISGAPVEDSCFTVNPTIVPEEPQPVPIEKHTPNIPGPAFYPGCDRDGDEQDWFQRGNK